MQVKIVGKSYDGDIDDYYIEKEALSNPTNAFMMCKQCCYGERV